MQTNGWFCLGGDGNNGFTNAPGAGTLLLNGGTLAASNIAVAGNIYFNGGTLKINAGNASLNTNPWSGGAANAYVSSGGAVIDTSGYNFYIQNIPLRADPALGLAPDGGLTKLGNGTLTLYASGNSYTGPTVVSGGTLVSNYPLALTSGTVGGGAAFVVQSGDGTNGWNRARSASCSVRASPGSPARPSASIRATASSPTPATSRRRWG